MRTYHHGDLSAACVAAGIELVEAEGPEAVTIRGVARLTGVSHQAPLHHFRDRNALLHAIAERGFVLLTDRLDREADPAAPAVERLRTYGVVYVMQAVEHPGLFQLMFAPCDRPPGEGAYRLLVDLCAASQASGALAGDDPFRLAMLVWSVVHGIASLYVANWLSGGMVTGQPADPRTAVEHALDDLFTGLSPAHEGGPIR